MNLAGLLQGVGSIGLFSSRVFLPAFLTALMLRFGGHLPLLEHWGLLAHTQAHPNWFTNNITLVVLGVLSGLEIAAQKNPEARHLLQEFDHYLKPALAALTSFGVISATDSVFVKQTVHQAGFVDGIVPFISALGTFRVAAARKQVMTAVFDHIEGTHLDHLIRWLEDAWVLFGTLFLVLFPIVMLILIGIGIGVLFLVRKHLAVLEERTKIACTNCGTSIYSCAIACPSCRAAVAVPTAIGFLGQSKPYPTNDLPNHKYRLVEKRRCPVCASRLLARKPFEPCGACRGTAQAEVPFVEAYIAYITRRLPVVLGISFLMSLVPILGLIVGVIYYRVELVLPFSQYLPLGKRFLLRWGIRLLFFVLVILQIVPLLGGLVVPVMALISFTAYRNSYRSLMLAPRAQIVQVPTVGGIAPAM